MEEKREARNARLPPFECTKPKPVSGETGCGYLGDFSWASYCNDSMCCNFRVQEGCQEGYGRWETYPICLRPDGLVDG